MKKYNFNHGSPEQLVDALNARISELGGDVEACGRVNSATYRDTQGCFTDVGGEVTTEDLRRIYDDDHDTDPVIRQYNSFDEWFNDSLNNGYLEKVESATSIDAAEGDNPMEDRIADALDDLQEDFDYFAAGIEKLMRSGANAGNEALVIIENCRNAVNEYIAQIAQTVEEL